MVTDFGGTVVKCINPRISQGFTILLFWGNPSNVRGAAPGINPTEISEPPRNPKIDATFLFHEIQNICMIR